MAVKNKLVRDRANERIQNKQTYFLWINQNRSWMKDWPSENTKTI